MKPRLRKWEVTMTVVNDIRGIHGSLTKLIPGRRIKRIIRDAVVDAIGDWRDLRAKNIKVSKVGKS